MSRSRTQEPSTTIYYNTVGNITFSCGTRRATSNSINIGGQNFASPNNRGKRLGAGSAYYYDE